MTAPERSFTRETVEDGYRRYFTPAGRYTAVRHGDVWVLTTPGLEVGRYDTVELAEAALDTDVQKRMWA